MNTFCEIESLRLTPGAMITAFGPVDICRVLPLYKVRKLLPWCEAGPPKHLDDKVDSDQQVVNKGLSLNEGLDLPSFWGVL